MIKPVALKRIVPSGTVREKLECRYCMSALHYTPGNLRESYGFKIAMGDSELTLCKNCVSLLLPESKFNMEKVLKEFELRRLKELMKFYLEGTTKTLRGYGPEPRRLSEYNDLRVLHHEFYESEKMKIILKKQEKESNKQKSPNTAEDYLVYSEPEGTVFTNTYINPVTEGVHDANTTFRVEWRIIEDT